MMIRPIRCKHTGMSEKAGAIFHPKILIFLVLKGWVNFKWLNATFYLLNEKRDCHEAQLWQKLNLIVLIYSSNCVTLNRWYDQARNFQLHQTNLCDNLFNSLQHFFKYLTFMTCSWNIAICTFSLKQAIVILHKIFSLCHALGNLWLHNFSTVLFHVHTQVA